MAAVRVELVGLVIRSRYLLRRSPSAQCAVAAVSLFLIGEFLSQVLGVASRAGGWAHDAQLFSLGFLAAALIGCLAHRDHAVAEARAALYTARRPSRGRAFRDSVVIVLARQGWTVTDYDEAAARWAVAERGGRRRVVVHTRAPVVTARAIGRIGAQADGVELIVIVRRGYVTSSARLAVRGGLLDATALGAWLANKRLAGRYLSRAHAEAACGLAQLGSLTWRWLKWARRAWLG
jgi:hypothetical protein